MDSLPAEVQKNVASFESKLDNLESLLQPIFKGDLKASLATATPVENAKLHLAVAHALNTLFYSMTSSSLNLSYVVYLNTQGHSASQHPVTGEIVCRHLVELIHIRTD